MPGNESQRFCDQCGHHVQNLSLLSKSEREELKSKAEGSRVCVAYYQDLDGKLIEATSEQEAVDKIHALKLAAVASGALVLSACSTDQPEIPIENHQQSPLPERCTLGIMVAPSGLRKSGLGIRKNGARERNRTSTGLPPHEPESCASTNSATHATSERNHSPPLLAIIFREFSATFRLGVLQSRGSRVSSLRRAMSGLRARETVHTGAAYQSPLAPRWLR